MIFITPYIIKDEAEAAEITRRKGEGLDEFRKKYGIEKKSAQPALLAPPPAVKEPSEPDTAGQTGDNQAPAPAGMEGTNGGDESGHADTAPDTSPDGAPVQSGPTGTAPAVPPEGQR